VNSFGKLDRVPNNKHVHVVADDVQVAIIHADPGPLELPEDARRRYGILRLVVRAEDMESAREIAEERYHAPGLWADSKRTSCIEINQDGPAEVILEEACYIRT
jgi:hypothetical protein